MLQRSAPPSRPTRSSVLFLVRFGAFLLALYLVLAVRPVDAAVVLPFTGLVARSSAAILNALGESVTVAGTEIRSPGFAVQIENGCNGLETVLLYTAAVLAFPASWTRRLLGLLLGFIAIETFNLIRVATLVWIGSHRPALFDASHTILWQSLVVLCGVMLFLLWASRARGARARDTASGGAAR